MPQTNIHTRLKSDEKIKTRPPGLYKVILHNDDYTTMDFVVDVLTTVFNQSLENATRLMLAIHQNGQAVCGLYPREIAETKVQTVHALAEANDFPLRSTMEKE